jgi:hypothetical protein
MKIRSGLAPALRIALFLGAVAMPVCAFAGSHCAGGGKPRPDEGGIGGTGIAPQGPNADEGGIGGTGARPRGPDDDEGGIGGTGISARGDVGVIGIITGFGSICVGDLEIEYDAESSVRIDGERASTAQLNVGQVVEVVASNAPSGLRASNVDVRHVVAGPVTRIDPVHGEIEVFGQSVRLLTGTLPSDLAPGIFVDVSGLRRADNVIAASLVLPTAAGLSRLEGTVEGIDGASIVVAGTPVIAPSGAAIAVGDEVRVAGQWDAGKLTASTLEPIPRVPFDGRVAQVEVEGFARRDDAGRLKVGPFEFDLSRTSAEALRGVQLGDRVRVRAVFQDRVPVVERIDVPNDAGSMRPAQPDGGVDEDVDGRDEWRPGDPNHRGGREARGVRDPAQRPGPADLDARPGGAPDRPAMPHVPDRPPRIDRPERPERPQRPERPAIPDRPPRPERPDLPRRP